MTNEKDKKEQIMYNKYIKLYSLYFLVIALCSVEPSYSMKKIQQIEPCEECKTVQKVKMRSVDLYIEKKPTMKKICKGCKIKIERKRERIFDNESKQQEAEAGASNLQSFLQQNPNLPAHPTIKTPPSAYPPGFFKK